MEYKTFEEELDAIRLAIYEEIKDMTPEEEVAYFKAQAAPIHEQFGIQTISETETAELMKRRRAVAV
jgi:hypothetical protein